MCYRKLNFTSNKISLAHISTNIYNSIHPITQHEIDTYTVAACTVDLHANATHAFYPYVTAAPMIAILAIGHRIYIY